LEHKFSELELKEDQNTPNADPPRKEGISKVCSRTNALLSRLLLPGLPQADRLRADVRLLTGKSEQKIDEELKDISQNGDLVKFIAHTKQSVLRNPHVLVAYAWVLYMALFSGGRYLRASLKAAGGQGKDFWDREPSPVRPHIITRDMRELHESEADLAEPSAIWSPRISGRGRAKSRSDNDIPRITPGLLFFEFIGDEDSEDIKLGFKKRITEAEMLLTQGEKDDIVAEAQDIFRFMLKMVGELDSIMRTTDEDLEMSKLFLQSPNLMATRDSVFVAQERLSRKTPNIPEKAEITRKSTFLEVLFTGPMAKLISFNELLPRVSFEHDTKLKDSGSERSWIQPHTVVVPILATFALFLVWYIGL
jgi:heme oxygenase